MTFQISQGLVDLLQVGILARTGEMQDQRALKLRAIKADAEGLAGFLFEEPFLNFPQTVRRGMAACRPLALRRDLDPLDPQLFVLPSSGLDHEVQGDFALAVKEDLIRLTDFNPGNGVSPDRGMDIGPEITLSYPPALGEIHNQKITGPQKDVVGGNDLLFSFGGHGG